MRASERERQGSLIPFTSQKSPSNQRWVKSVDGSLLWFLLWMAGTYVLEPPWLLPKTWFIGRKNQETDRLIDLRHSYRNHQANGLPNSSILLYEVLG